MPVEKNEQESSRTRWGEAEEGLGTICPFCLETKAELERERGMLASSCTSTFSSEQPVANQGNMFLEQTCSCDTGQCQQRLRN